MDTISSTLQNVVSRVSSGVTFALSNQHPITKGWPLTNVWLGMAIVSSYVLLVMVLKSWIQYRGRGFELKPVVLLHNFCMCALSAYMMIETLRQAIINRYSLIGNRIDESPAGYGVRMTHTHNPYMFSV